MTAEPMTDTKFQEVRLYTGSVAHLVDPKAPPAPGVDRVRQPALCNIRPIWPGVWQLAEIDFPLCLNCKVASENGK